MKNIREIAKLAGVSHSTVSRVINGSQSVKEMTRLRVEQVMAEYGYKPNVFARGMLGVTQTTLGIVIPNVLDPFFSELISAVENVCLERSAQLLIAEGKRTADSEFEAINYLLNKGCDRLLIHSKALSDEQLGIVLKRSPEIFLINRQLSGFDGRFIAFDNYTGARQSALAVIERGRRHIAVVTPHFTIADSNERLNGFSDELIQHGLTLNKDMIFNEESTQKGGMIAARTMLASGKLFDAVLCYNDMMAIGVIQALSDNGIRVPDDVSVVGFDDLEIAQYFVPRLSTIHYPVAEMAEQMVNCLLENMEHNNCAQNGALTAMWAPLFVGRESH